LAVKAILVRSKTANLQEGMLALPKLEICDDDFTLNKQMQKIYP